MKKFAGAAAAAWLVAAIYYFYQYILRAAPSAMIPQLSQALGLSAIETAALAGLFYYGYAVFSLIAGSATDRWGPRAVAPAGAMLVGVGALLFGTGIPAAANMGRLLQGAGGVFALVAAVYIAGKNFPASHAATLIGATQMFGMLGGSVGQLSVGPLLSLGLSWNGFWIAMGLLGFLIAAALFMLVPKQQPSDRPGGGIAATAAAFGSVFRNPQSILCGLIAGLLFIPTTIFDMIWGVRFLQEAHGLEYGDAVMRSATVPLGWIIGCPLLGLLSDWLGRRKPVIVSAACVLLACLGWILYGPRDLFPPYTVGFIAGVASGAAMLPYTIIKEANAPQFAGTATGVVSFLNLAFSALMGPVFGWIMQSVSSGRATPLEHYQMTFQPLLYGVGLAVVLTLTLLKETGAATRVAVVAVETI
jgi:sugar phosphate permease